MARPHRHCCDPPSSSSLCASSSSVDDSSDTPGVVDKPVLLIGPGFLQLVIAKHMIASQSGLRPIVVAPQTKLDNYFKSFVKTGTDESHTGDEDPTGAHQQLETDSTIGMPEVADPYFGDLWGVVFCAEEALLPPAYMEQVLDYTDQGLSAFVEDGPHRVITCLPVSNKVVNEKSNSWIPIFNMSAKKQTEVWTNFEHAFRHHPTFQDKGTGSILRFGSLFGGSIDGPPQLQPLGLDEGIYKMSLEQYRDMRERSFDRYKLAAQVLQGDTINPKPPQQDAQEKAALQDYPGPVREMFNIVGNYPEIDRSNRHTVAAGIVQALLLPTNDQQEMTILSKASSDLTTPEEWRALLTNPASGTSLPAWPDPTKFNPEEYGITTTDS